MRILPEREAENMIKALQKAEMNERELIIEDFANQFENDLTIIGATGLLD